MNGWRRAVVLATWALCWTDAPQAQTPSGGMHHAAGGIVYHAPQWSPDGKWLVMSSNLDGDTEIYVVGSDGSALRQLTRNAVPDDNGRWSADGRRVLFQSERSGKVAQYSMDLEGRDVRPEPLDSVISRNADGTVLLFESVRGGLGRLFLMTSSRTNVRQLAVAGHVEQGSFSPDGQSIVYEQRATMHDDIPKSQIVVTRPDGSEPRVVASATDPSWSRDGQLILFKNWDDATQQLWISTVSPTGAGFRRLTPGVHPTWSPDGSRIAYMRDRDDGGADVWIMNRDGSAGRCLTCPAPFR